MPRRQAAVAAALLGVSSSGGKASAEVLKQVEEVNCVNCGGDGTISCLNCGGTGQFKMLSARTGGTSGQYMYVDCPDCAAVGQQLCARCSGTGLPTKKLRGFLRDPAYRKILKRMRKQQMKVDDVPQIKIEVQEALAEIAEREKAEKAAA